MSRGTSRQSRAADRQQKKLESADWSWKIWKRCEICGQNFCVNSFYEDRKPRTNKYLGIPCCFACDPRACDPDYGYPHMSTTIRDKDKYRIFMTYVLTKKLAKMPCMKEGPLAIEPCKCLSCAARKLIERTTP